MNAMTGSILEIGEEVPGGMILDLRTVASPAAGPRRRRRLGPGESVRFGWLLGPFLLLLAWSTGSAAGLIDSRVLPAPWTTAETASQLIRDGRLPHDLAVSALRAGEGFIWGAAVGIVAALASGLSQLGGYVIDGLVQIKRSIPVLALIPLIILWFGIGETMKVTVIAISVFVPMYIQTHA
ncbi:MAG TPA: hypothetical protein VGH03_22085, partial [Caulobacteraceae bacterium]